MIINLKELKSFKGSLSDLEIEDGDSIKIPEFPESIHLVGGVKNPSSVVYKTRNLDVFILTKSVALHHMLIKEAYMYLNLTVAFKKVWEI